MLEADHIVFSPRARDFEAERRAVLQEARRQLIETSRDHFSREPERIDGLTGVQNRETFRARLRYVLQRLQRQPLDLMVACIDLEGIEELGRVHGQEVADEMLRIAAARLSARIGNHAVGRNGADEFACLLHAARSADHASRLAGALHDALSAPCEIPGLKLGIRPSIGIACFPYDGTTDASLLMRSEAAMLRARHYRTGYAFYSGELDAAFATPARADG